MKNFYQFLYSQVVVAVVSAVSSILISTNSFALSLSMNSEIPSKPHLSKKQMLEDFDLAVDYINTFAVHKDLNAIRLNINYEAQFSRLREKIHSQTDYCEFRAILEKLVNLVQDSHASFMPYDYFQQYGKYQKKLNFKDDASYEAIRHHEVLCKTTPPKLKLPILYQNGSYYFFADFLYQGHTIKRGTQIQSYNKQAIDQYIANNFDTVWPVRFDQDKDQVYSTNFYRFGERKFSLGLTGGENISFDLDSEIKFLKEIRHEIYYQSQKKEQLHYFEQEGVLYIGLPMMDVSLAEKLNKQISTLVAQNKKFSKIIIDIRGNPGGNDMTWRTLIAHLYAKSFSLSVTPKFKYNPQVLSRYATPKDGAKPEIEPLLNNAQYWTKKFDVRTTDRSPDSIDFRGKVYLLQDDYIYSSAGNFSNFALTNDEIISVGSATDLVGGAQVEPLFYRLKNSQWIFRVEPMLDFSNVKKLNDFAHNEVEVKITPTIEDHYLRTTYDGDIYSKDFLLHYDKLVKYVIDQH